MFHQSKCISTIKCIPSTTARIYPRVLSCVGVYLVTAVHVWSLAPCVWEWRRCTIQQLQALALQPDVWGISCLVLLPPPCNYSSLYVSFSNRCKAIAVTHTKRIDRNLLRKETSFVCYTSSVLRKSRHMKQKEKIAHCCWDQNSRLQKLKITKIEYNCNSSTKHSHNTFQRIQIVTAIRLIWLTKNTFRV